MSIFSKFKKAKAAANEHKKAVANQSESKPPPPPYRHIPTHAAQDARAATPTSSTHAETLTKITAARKRRSESVRTAPSPYQSYAHSRASSHRVQSDMSLNSVVMKEPSPSQPFSVSPVHSREPKKNHDDYSFHPQGQTPSRTKDVPNSLSVPTRPRVYHTSSHRSSMKKSPLSNMAMEEEPEKYFSSSSQDSSYTAESDQSSGSFSNNNVKGANLPTWTNEDFSGDIDAPVTASRSQKSSFPSLF